MLYIISVSNTRFNVTHWLIYDCVGMKLQYGGIWWPLFPLHLRFANLCTVQLVIRLSRPKLRSLIYICVFSSFGHSLQTHALFFGKPTFIYFVAFHNSDKSSSVFSSANFLAKRYLSKSIIYGHCRVTIILLIPWSAEDDDFFGAKNFTKLNIGPLFIIQIMIVIIVYLDNKFSLNPPWRRTKWIIMIMCVTKHLISVRSYDEATNLLFHIAGEHFVKWSRKVMVYFASSILLAVGEVTYFWGVSTKTPFLCVSWPRK